MPPSPIAEKLPSVPKPGVSGRVTMPSTSGIRLTAATVLAEASVTLRMTRVIEKLTGGVGMVTVAPVASNTPLLSKSHRKESGSTQPGHWAVAVNVREEPGTTAELVQKTFQFNVAAGS